MTRQIDAGRVIAITGAAALIAALFMTWYEPGRSGWNVFESLDLLLAGSAVAVTATALGFFPAAGRSVTVVLAAAAFVATAINLLDGPPTASGAAQIGAWFGFGAAAAMVGGVLLWQSRIAMTVTVSGRDGRPRAVAVDRRHRDEQIAPEKSGSEPVGEPLVYRIKEQDPGRTESFEAIEEFR